MSNLEKAAQFEGEWPRRRLAMAKHAVFTTAGLVDSRSFTSGAAIPLAMRSSIHEAPSPARFPRAKAACSCNVSFGEERKLSR